MYTASKDHHQRGHFLRLIMKYRYNINEQVELVSYLRKVIMRHARKNIVFPPLVTISP